MSNRNLNHLHPKLKPLCDLWLTTCAKQSLYPKVYYTWRSVEEQDEIYAQGRTKPGAIRTNAKGGQSKHNFTIDGKPASKAFDFYMEIGGVASWDSRTVEWKTAVIYGKKLGLTWGGDFKNLYDAGHFQID